MTEGFILTLVSTYVVMTAVVGAPSAVWTHFAPEETFIATNATVHMGVPIVPTGVLTVTI